MKALFLSPGNGSQIKKAEILMVTGFLLLIVERIFKENNGYLFIFL
jgi:hypothetical protein